MSVWLAWEGSIRFGSPNYDPFVLCLACLKRFSSARQRRASFGSFLLGDVGLLRFSSDLLRITSLYFASVRPKKKQKNYKLNPIRRIKDKIESVRNASNLLPPFPPPSVFNLLQGRSSGRAKSTAVSPSPPPHPPTPKKRRGGGYYAAGTGGTWVIDDNTKRPLTKQIAVFHSTQGRREKGRPKREISFYFCHRVSGLLGCLVWTSRAAMGLWSWCIALLFISCLSRIIKRGNENKYAEYFVVNVMGNLAFLKSLPLWI